MPDEVNETEPTEAMVEAVDRELPLLLWVNPVDRIPVIRRVLSAARAVDPLPAELLRLRGENERIFERHNRLADALAAAVGDENGECVACGGSAVGDPSDHHLGCWVADEVSGVTYDRWQNRKADAALSPEDPKEGKT